MSPRILVYTLLLLSCAVYLGAEHVSRAVLGDLPERMRDTSGSECNIFIRRDIRGRSHKVRVTPEGEESCLLYSPNKRGPQCRHLHCNHSTEE